MPNYKEVSLIYKSLFDTSIDGIIVIDEKGIMQDANNAIVKLMGYSKEELVGNNVSMLMGTPHKARHDGYLSRYKKTKEAKIIGIGREVEAVKKDGTIFPIRLAVSEFLKDGKSFYTGIIHDLNR